MKTDQFEKGDSVWIYQHTTLPREGVVEEVKDIGCLVIDSMGGHLYHESALYARPQDRDVLQAAIEDDAEHMQWVAKRFGSSA